MKSHSWGGRGFLPSFSPVASAGAFRLLPSPTFSSLLMSLLLHPYFPTTAFHLLRSPIVCVWIFCAPCQNFALSRLCLLSIKPRRPRSFWLGEFLRKFVFREGNSWWVFFLRSVSVHSKITSFGYIEATGNNCEFGCVWRFYVRCCGGIVVDMLAVRLRIRRLRIFCHEFRLITWMTANIFLVEIAVFF